MADWPDIDLTRGDTYEEYFKFLDPLDAPLNLSGCTVWLTAKEAVDDDAADATGIIKHYIVISGVGAVTGSSGFALGGKDPETGATVSTAAAGVVTHTITAAESTVMATQDYVYDVQFKDATGRISTIINGGTITVLGDVTRRVTTP
jgi:hypothetical protein